MSPRLRRAIGLTAVPALALSTLAALPSAPAYAAEPDPAPAAAGGAWLKGQLTDGLVFNPNFGGFNDYGLSIDFGLALDAVGGEDQTLNEISAALADEVGGYVGDGTTESWAGSLAKAAVLAAAAGDDPTAYGGVDLVERLEARVSDSGATLGRIQDASPFGDFANTFGQLFAARALDGAGSAEAEAATEFLLQQQCDEGFFRQDFSAFEDEHQSCDGDPESAPSTDVTALAILQLLPQADDIDVQAAIDAATAWLVEEQAADGSFGSGSDIPTPNTNSTGLAGWALGETENTQAAEKAAAWIRAHQVDEPAPCSTALNSDQGALAYDVAALANGRQDGITVGLQDQWRRASAQALPALQWAPATGTGPIIPIETSGFHRAGSRVTLGADGFAPGDAVCFRLGTREAALGLVGANGQALAKVTLPDGSRTRTYLSSTGESEGQPLSFRVLDAKRLRFDLKKVVARGGKQVVKLRGLAAGEHYKVKYRGKRVDAGTATSEGRATERFRVGRKLGKAKILVVGEFSNRRGTRTFRVVR